MPHQISATGPNQRNRTNVSISLGLVAVILFFAATSLVSYLNTRILSQNAALVTRTHDIITTINEIQALVINAETGQRGYLITGDENYLQPYAQTVTTIDPKISDLAAMIADSPEQQAQIAAIRSHIGNKLDELKETIELRRERGFEAARDVVTTDRGKESMDSLRAQLNAIEARERDVRAERLAQMHEAYGIALVSGLLTGLLGIVLSIAVAFLIRRAFIMRQQQEWMQSGQVELSAAMIGEKRVEQLGESILAFMADYFGAHAGAFFTRDSDGYRRIATYGVPANGGEAPERFTLGDGLLGQAAKDGKSFALNDVPDGYLTVGSALGQGNPRHLIIVPATVDGMVNAVFELGFMHPVDEMATELLDKVAESIGTAVRSAEYRANLQNFLEETQRQAEEMQAQGEELRVSNEELEEQSRALKESQTRLEQQQAELEQTNSQLEEQTQILEGQRDDLARAKAAVQLKAQELEQASQYKSDFLANMSHELRTPLNSSLILAKLLADNPSGNLSTEQVKFAQTIESSGNDLLALINDILDLSKIEAGHMEVRPEPVSLDRMVKDMARLFDPVAQKKNLTFHARVAQGCPDIVETDRQRIEQIVKNLLSNAIKFTEKGEVGLDIGVNPQGDVAFAVTDTGIGIAPDQQDAIFEAFRQADGTISRKYGGTGLGLSISRQLARLLGGHIELKSESGKGSVFTVTIPLVYNPERIAPRASAPDIQAPQSFADDVAETPADKTPKPIPRRIRDDRENLSNSGRSILIIEDDESFARILYDLARELDFQCIVAQNAEEGLLAARQYLPNAVVLDVGLPDNSGLSVLDRLKRDARTRHIPVHIVSGEDYSQTAMSLGAIGYMVKPVKREELVSALERLETTFAQRLRRVLIVEDDDVQRDSVEKLLGSHDVETLGVGTAAECLERLKTENFDCMVLDLSLPDASGYTLLETLSAETDYSFPPVIVYTGRELSVDEEQRLRKYSKSIIIKGAKSPERLLDEVTLFLHQVVSELPAEQQRMLEVARNRDAVLEGRRILVVEDDVANVYALTSILEPRGAIIQIARNGLQALEALEKSKNSPDAPIDLVLMDMMMPEMDGLTATRSIRKRSEWKKLPVIMLTAKAMRDDQDRCLEAGANDYMAKPLDVEKLLSLIRVWMPR